MADQTRLNETLIVIGDYVREHHYPPSVRDIAALCGVISTSTIARRLERMEVNGWLTTDRNVSRSCVLTVAGREAYDALCADRQAVA